MYGCLYAFMYGCMYVWIFFPRVAYLGLLAGTCWPFASGVPGQFSCPSAGTVVVLLEVVDCYVLGCVTGLAGCHGQC